VGAVEQSTAPFFGGFMAFFKGCFLAVAITMIAGLLLFINPSWPLAAIIFFLVVGIVRVAR
jgi:hypothetical protein